MSKARKPFGLWSSPISPEMIGDSLSFNDVQWDSSSNTLVWSERRGKQSVLVSKTGHQAMRDITDSRFSPRGSVLYGGGEFTVNDGLVYFVDGGRLYRVALDGGIPHPITPKFGGAAAPKVSPDGQWVIFVHTYEDNDILAIVDSEGTNFPQKLVHDTDFVMQPAWSSDGQLVAVVVWNHPKMPWLGTELRLLTLSYEGNVPFVTSTKVIAGDENTAIAQPEFSPDGRYLSYISDQSGWYQLYLYDLATSKHEQITTDEVEHGIPQWIQGNHTYGWTADNKNIAYIRHQRGIYSVWSYNLHNKTHHDSGLDEFGYTHFDRISVSQVSGDIAGIASASNKATEIVTFGEDGIVTMRYSTTNALSDEVLSEAQAIEWQGHDGETAHGLYFAPKNPVYEGIGGVPPLMVLIHGGPTSQRNATFDLEVQFFTSRGYAVLQVNHRGSTGYGRAYVDKHQGNWGVYDVQDSITGAQYLVDEGLADASKIVIMGGSAGGYTALQALIDAPNFFKAAVVSYGVADQFSLVMDTHKFEAYYSDWLLGTLPDAAEKYRDRSPLYHAHKIKDAIIVFQGSEDNVVPKSQSDAIVGALRRNGVPHEYVVYEGEGHGIRKPENVIDFYNQTLSFLEKYVIYT